MAKTDGKAIRRETDMENIQLFQSKSYGKRVGCECDHSRI